MNIKGQCMFQIKPGDEVIMPSYTFVTTEDHSLVAEVEELQANPNAPAVGTVIESRLEVGRGPVATVIVQRGTLKQGSSIVAGGVSGRVRAMFNDQEQQVKTAGPSTPVLVMGWDDVPSAGDMFEVVKNDRTARKLADERKHLVRSATHVVPTATERLETLLENLRTADHAELRIIVRADVWHAPTICELRTGL